MSARVSLFALGFLLLGSAALAADGAEPGDLGIFADLEATTSSVELAPWMPRTIYVVAFPPAEGVSAFELSISMPEAIVASWQIVPPAPTQMEMEDHSWIVALQHCQPGGGPAVLMALHLTATAPLVDATICIDQMAASSLRTTANGLPGYTDCVDRSTHAFTAAQNGQGVYPDGCLVVNPTMAPPVGVEPLGFGALKSRF